jgi:hypothetical protein
MPGELILCEFEAIRAQVRFGIGPREFDLEEDEDHRRTAQGYATDRVDGMQQLRRRNPTRAAGGAGAPQNQRLHD